MTQVYSTAHMYHYKWLKAVGEDDFQPRIGFKTRYGMASNPFVGATPSDGLAAVKTNQYYRIFKVTDILT